MIFEPFEPVIPEYRYKLSVPDFKKYLVDGDNSISIEGTSTAYDNPFRCYALRSGKITHNTKMMFVEWVIVCGYYTQNDLREYILNDEGREMFTNLFNRTFPDNYFEGLPDLAQYLDDYNAIKDFLNK